MNGVRWSRVVVAGAIAALAGGMLAVGVAAHTSHSPTSVTINAGLDYFYGTVSSPNEKCEPHRKVRVFRKKPGNDKLFGTEKSLAGMNQGSYTVDESTVPFQDGRYYSDVAKRDLRRDSGRHDHLCREATSNTVDLN